MWSGSVLASSRSLSGWCGGVDQLVWNSGMTGHQGSDQSLEHIEIDDKQLGV
jgi:hypothetical protein